MIMITKRTTRSMTTMALVLLISMAIVVTLPVIALGAEPFELLVNVLPGQKAVIKFQFPDPPTTPEGPADILLINGGSVNNGLLVSQVSLSLGGQLIGSYTNTQFNGLPSSPRRRACTLYSVRIQPTFRGFF